MVRRRYKRKHHPPLIQLPFRRKGGTIPMQAVTTSWRTSASAYLAPGRATKHLTHKSLAGSLVMIVRIPPAECLVRLRHIVILKHGPRQAARKCAMCMSAGGTLLR